MDISEKAIFMILLFLNQIRITKENCTVGSTDDKTFTVCCLFQDVHIQFTDITVNFNKLPTYHTFEENDGSDIFVGSFLNGTLVERFKGESVRVIDWELLPDIKGFHVDLSVPNRGAGTFLCQLLLSNTETLKHTCVHTQELSPEKRDLHFSIPLTVTGVIAVVIVIAVCCRKNCLKTWRKRQQRNHGKKHSKLDVHMTLSRPLLLQDSISEVFPELHPNKEHLVKIKSYFKKHLNLQNTFITSLLNKSENGNILVLDHRPDRFLVSVVRLNGNGTIPSVTNKYFVIPPVMKRGKGSELFDEFAKGIAWIIRENSLSNEKLPLTFIFPFQCQKKSLASAVLTTWDQNYQCEDVVGKDVAVLLEDALNRKKIKNVDVQAVILCRSVGTLLHGVNQCDSCDIGLFIDHKFNISCWTDKQKVGFWKRHFFQDSSSPKVFRVDMDTTLKGFRYWDCFKTDFDNLETPCKNPWQDLTDEPRLGAIVIRVLQHLVSKEILSIPAEEFDCLQNLHSKFVLEILESDHENTRVENILEHDLGMKTFNKEDCKIIRNACHLVVKRTALLLASCIAGLIEHMNQPKVSIAMDGLGSLVLNPVFRYMLKTDIKELLNPNLSFELNLHRGIAEGAALVAAVSLHAARTSD